MGPKRIQTLFKTFQDIENIAKADSNIIVQKTNIPLNIAREIILVAKQFYSEQKPK